MDVERVIFSVGQTGAVDAYSRTFELGLWGAHTVFIGDHLAVTVFTSDTPARLRAAHKRTIERAVVEAGQGRYLDLLVPQYGARVSRQLGGYFMAMARDALRVPSVLTTQQ